MTILDWLKARLIVGSHDTDGVSQQELESVERRLEDVQRRVCVLEAYRDAFREVCGDRDRNGQ